MSWRRGSTSGGAGVTFAAPTNVLEIGDTALEGTSGQALRSDVVFAFPDPAGGPPAVAGASVEGVATTPARSDHTHAVDVETIQDIVGALVAAGTNVTVTYNDAGNTLTIAVANEAIDDRVAALLVAGSNISLTYNDAGDALTIAVTGLALSAEDVQDIVGAFIVDSTEIDFTYDDAGNTLTAALKPGSVALSRLATDPLARAGHTGTQLASTVSDFAEAVDDRVAALLVAGAGITLTYNDGANTLTIAASGTSPTGGSVSASVATQESTTSTAYTDLPTIGPAQTWTPGASGKALAIISSELDSAGVAADSMKMSFVLSGGNTLAAADALSISVNRAGQIRASGVFLLTGLAAVATTATAKYRTAGGVTQYAKARDLLIVPL